MTYAIAALLTALLGPALIVTARQRSLFGAKGYRSRLIASASLWGAACGAVSLAVLSGQSLKTVGLGLPTWSTLGWGLAFGILGLAVFPVYIAFSKMLGLSGTTPATAMADLATIPLPIRVFLLLTAGVAEELLFRAVPIPLLTDLTGSLAFAVIVPLSVFVLLHRASWGLVHLLFVTIGGVVMTCAFLLGGLWAAVLAHLVVDAPMMLFASAMARRTGNAVQASPR